MRNAPTELAWFVVRFLVFVTAVAGLGCATPQPLVSLVPRNPAGVMWVDGRATQQKTDGGVRAAVAFESERGGLLGVHLEVQNTTDTTFDVTPDDVTYMTCADRANDTCDGSFGVVDPEEMLMSIDEGASRERANASNEGALLGTLTILSAVGDVASIASHKADSHTGLNTALLGGALAESEQEHRSQSIAYATERQLWSDYAFRRNTLTPGRGTSGLVYVPINCAPSTSGSTCAPAATRSPSASSRS